MILGAVALGFVVAVVIAALIEAALMKLSPEALGGFLLVIATIFLVVATYQLKTSAEEVAEKQIKSAAKLAKDQQEAAEALAERQTYSLKWMEEQKTRPYCDFVAVLKTSTDTPIGMHLKNLGHGPALHMKWKFWVYDKPTHNGGRKGLQEVLDRFPILNNMLEVYVPEFMAASSDEPIFRLRDKPKQITVPEVHKREKATEVLQEMIFAIKIELTVKSAMGETAPVVVFDGAEIRKEATA
jgi:hypothetical protein